MKKLYIWVFLMVPFFSFGQTKIATSQLQKKIDSLLTIVKGLPNSKKDSTLIKIDKLDEVFKKTEPKWYDKYLPAIIALFTVLISAGVAYYVGVRNAKTQIKNSETQARTQIAIASDQLEISRKQIEQNTKNTLAQIRSNNISKARIEWIQTLRPLLSDFFANITNASIIMDEIVEAKKAQNKEVGVKHINFLKEILIKIEGQNNQIDLFLNPQNKSHKELQKAVNCLTETLKYNDDLSIPNNKKEVEEVIEKSRIVLKEAWEQAKSENEI